MSDRPLGIRNVLEEERKLIENIEKRSALLIESLEDLDNILEAVDRDKIIFAAAFNFTYELIQDKAFDFLLIEAKKAIISSVEFNYPPFVERFLQALILNYNYGGMININIDSDAEKITGVDIDLSGLGSVETYGHAVDAARANLGMGKTDAEIASIMWKEKIYGVAREGVRVYKKYKGKVVRFSDEFLQPWEDKEIRYGQTENPSGEVSEEKDITERYKDKYAKTIAERLAYIPADEAPYWYIIEFGNAGLSLSSDFGGTPYPVVEPTSFIRNTELAIEEAFSSALAIYKDEASLYLGGLIAENFGLEGFTGSVKDLPREVKELIKERLLGTAIVEARETSFRGALDYIDTQVGRMHLYVTSKGNLRITVQDRTTKRWISPKVLLGQ